MYDKYLKRRILIMWKFITFFLFMVILLAAAAVGLSMAPHYLYSKVLKNEIKNKWFYINEYRNDLLTPSRYPFKNIESMSADNLWKDFQMGDVLIPLPYKHPFYKIVPLLDAKKKNMELGLSFRDLSNREFAKVFFIENNFFKNVLQSQELFKLPISRDIIRKVKKTIIWADLFSKEIKDNNIDYAEMIYNLYLLQLRHLFIHKNAISFGNIGQQDVGIIMLESADMDFDCELVMTMRNGMIYSYVLFTDKASPEGRELRDRFLNKVKFIRGDQNIAKINYNEFKALPFTSQAKQEGLIYLYAAWSNWQEKQEELLKEIIFYAERGRLDQQLKIFYQYALDKYGKTLSSLSSDQILDTKLKLTKKIEEEKDDLAIRQKAIIEQQEKIKNEPELSSEQRLKLKLRNAKEAKRQKQDKQVLN